MNDVSGAPATREPALVSDQAAARLAPSGFDPARDEFDYDENDCANCSGEGFVYGCSWDWQCDTYDEGEGTCLCTRPCDWCSPRKPDPALRAVLAAALSRDSDAGSAEDPQGLHSEGAVARAEGIAQPSPASTPTPESI